MKKSVILPILLLLLLTACARQQVPPADYIGEKAAKEIALTHAGLTADEATFLPTELEREDGRQIYDVAFYTAENAAYDYEIDAVTGEVVRCETGQPLPAAVPAADGAHSQEEARAAALSRAGLTEQDVTFTKAEMDREDGRTLYEFAFTAADRTEYECDVAALTGEVVYFECDRAYAAAPTDPNRPLIGHEEAKAIALAHAGLAADETLFSQPDAFADFDWDDGRPICEVRFSKGTAIFYEYDVDARTGEIVKYSEERIPDSAPPGPEESGHRTGPVTADEAKTIALGMVPGAAAAHITDFEGDYDDGRLAYEIEIRYGGMEYDFEIDSTDGTVLKMESEPID